jgi:hypothetical protein
LSSDFLPLTGNPANPEERGNLIGLGGQYTVHDVGGGRVMKIRNSIDGSRLFVGGYGPHVLKMKRHIPMEETAIYSGACVPHVLRLAARYPALSEALANPTSAPGNCFTQDKVDPIRELMPSSTPSQIRGFLDGYADVCQLCWRHGIHDYIIFFLVNCAVDAEGTLLLLDFGETAFDTTVVANSIKKREWETKNSLLKELPEEYHAYYFKAVTDRLSGDNFERHWAADLDDLDKMVIRKPDLRERREDIPVLVDRILARANQEEGWKTTGVSSDTIDLFREYDWNGGGVQLQNVLYRAAELRQSGQVQLNDLPEYILKNAHNSRVIR